MAHLPATHPKNSLPPHITTVEISEKEIPLADLVTSYLCNGQIITDRDQRRIFLAPARCQHLPTVTQWLNQNITRFADDLRYIPVEESLKNGGGPACLRLRMPLTAQEYQQVHPGIKLTPAKIKQLEHLVNSLYPDRFHPTDILEAACLDQCLRAVAAISEMM
jgi:succinylarginine dihydrolase